MRGIPLLSVFLGVVVAAFAGPRRKVIIDQDAFGPGGPNLHPIVMVLQSPDVEVLGITIESGDGWQKENVAHALRLLEIVGRTDVPVVPGATFPLVNSPEATRRWESRYGKLAYKGAWTEEWPAGTVKRRPVHPPDVVPPSPEGAPSTKPLAETADAFLGRKVREFPGEVSILALGPLTNLALALKRDPGFAPLAKEIVIMGGSFNPHAMGNEFDAEHIHNPRLEFNFRWDPEAADAVLRAPWAKVTLAPIDPTTRTLFTPELIKRIGAADTPVARYVARHVEGFPMWDELATAVWLKPDLVTRREVLAVGVDIGIDGAAYGSTLSWPAGKGPGRGERDMAVVFEVDVSKLESLVANLLTGNPH
ncbi:MAG TPA: nucleoside hydrolase [Lacunisphaera sp.]|nr:nucleoside hydrolase [Lacunisphaera sp.]